MSDFTVHDQFRIRDFRDEDFSELMLLWELTDLGNPSRGDNLDVIHRTLDQEGRLFLMEETQTGNLAGSAWITCDGRRLYLHHFGIHPALQNQGLGTFLTRHCLKYASTTGLQIKLEVHRKNDAARALYRHAGFQDLGDYQVMIIRTY